MGSIALSREQVREVDRIAIEEIGLCGLVLMENAGRGCADVLCQVGVDGPVLICCGKGNNGGDGFVVARHLLLRGHDVQVLLCGRATDLRGDALANYGVLGNLGMVVAEATDGEAVDRYFASVARTAWIVDALLGTGAQGEPRSPMDRCIEQINTREGKVLSIDIPSGLDCDTGQPSLATVRANCTCTFVASKIGFTEAAAREYLGQVHLVDIGVPAWVLSA